MTAIPPRPASRRAVGLLLAAAAGVGVAAQAWLNGELAARIEAGITAAGLSFAGGTLILLVLAVSLPRMRRGLRQVAREAWAGRLHPTHLLGGIAGAFLVMTQGLTVGVLGVAIFTVAVVAGQTTSSLVVDRIGVGPGGARPLTPTRIAGAGLTLAAVLLAVSDQLGAPAAVAAAVLPLLAGVGVAWQQAVNARVRAAARTAAGGVAGSALPAALVNFAVGSIVLAVAVAIEIAVRGLPAPLPAEPLLYLGGPLGLLFIATAAAVVGRTGVLLFALAAIGGQLVGSLILDLLVPTAGGRPTVATVAGTVLALVAVAVAALPAGGKGRAGRIRAGRRRPA